MTDGLMSWPDVLQNTLQQSTYSQQQHYYIIQPPTTHTNETLAGLPSCQKLCYGPTQVPREEAISVPVFIPATHVNTQDI